MNMFKPNKAKTIEEYFENLSEDRRKAFIFLHDLILKTSASLKSNFLYNMPGYGKFKYINYKKEVVDWPIISLASQKNYISLYICALDNGEYLAEKYKVKLGKVSVGKSCIRFKNLENVNLDELKRIIKLAEKSPGI